MLTSSRREYYIFSGPPCGIIFSENREKILAINNFFVNETKSGQPNKRLFLLTLASSDATAYWPIIDQRPVEQTAYRREIKDNGYKSVFTNSWLVRQRNRSWIKGLGKNPQKSKLVRCWQCLLSGATEPWLHGLREYTCIQVKRHDGTPCVCVLTRLPSPRQNTKIGMLI